jgi:hypothetical protein
MFWATIPYMLPPRHLTTDSLLQLLAVFIASFLLASRKVPARFYGYIGIILSFLFIYTHGYHVYGTIRSLGLSDSIGRYAISTIIVSSVFLASWLGAYMKQLIIDQITRKMKANLPNERTG